MLGFFYSISFIIHRKPTLLLLSWLISSLQIMVLLLVGKNVGSLLILIVDMNNKLTLITLTFTVRWEYYDMWQYIYTFSSCYRGHEIVIIYVCKMCCRHNTFRFFTPEVVILYQDLSFLLGSTLSLSTLILQDFVKFRNSKCT